MFLGKFKDESGTSAIEFACYIFIFTLMCGLMIDISSSVIKKGQLERVNNSLMAILRERNDFYNGRINFSKEDVEQLDNIANVLLADSDGTVEPHQLTIRMIEFSPDSTSDNKIRGLERTFSTIVVAGCDYQTGTKTSIDTLSNLSAWGVPPTAKQNATNPFWYPVYEITLCVPGAVSYFHQMIGGFKKNMSSLNIRNVAIPRI